MSQQNIVPPLHVAMVSPEISPFAKTGGLGEMVSSLAKALEGLGLRVSLIMPAYRTVMLGDFPLENTAIIFNVPVSDRREEAGLLKVKISKNIEAFFIDADKYFDRENLYGTNEGDYFDNAERFTFFNRAVLEVLRLDPPHVIHAHDWQSALTVAFLKSQPQLYPELASVKTIFTVHNLGYQGIFQSQDWHLLNLDWSFFSPGYLEFYGKINFLKAGLVFADIPTTVSPAYAEEIKTTEHGFGLEGVFKERAASLVGILNGVDYDIWSPGKDPLIAKRYSFSGLPGKKICKSDLQRSFGLAENPAVPLIGMVSRLSAQKGIDLLEEILHKLLFHNIQLAILGTGEKGHEDALRHEARRHSKLGVRITFDESLAHKIIAGSDILVLPSRYEPCGLAQLYALKYGTIPVVRATGGLKDTIHEFDAATNNGNGFSFGPYASADFMAAIERALRLFHQPAAWTALIGNAMAADFSWARSAKIYAELYRKLLEK